MKRVLLGLALGIAPSSGAIAQSPVAAPPDSLRASIAGIVRDSLGIPVDGASVMITPGGMIFRTDSAGRFLARNVTVGPLTVSVRKLGLSPLQTRFTGQPGVELTLDLVMQRLPRMLAEVEILAEQNRQCARRSLEGILCRREVGRGAFMNRQDILATNVVFPWLVLRDQPGFRQNLNGNPTRVESIEGWRCITTLVDGRQPSRIDPIPRVRDMFAVEVYQRDEYPPEFQQWRGVPACTLVVFWSMRVGRQSMRDP